MPLWGWQTTLSALSLSLFGIGDVSIALNAPAMSLHAPRDNAWRTLRCTDEMMWLVKAAAKVERCFHCHCGRAHLHVCMRVTCICPINYVFSLFGFNEVFTIFRESNFK